MMEQEKRETKNSKFSLASFYSGNQHEHLFFMLQRDLF